MHSQDVRTIFVDTSWCTVENDGSFRMDLPQTVEAQPDLVGYVDDITVTGSLPQVSTANNRLYVLERTPYGWDFAAAVSNSGELSGSHAQRRGSRRVSVQSGHG